jgi:mRNA-degrading endonuclease toxin of MazEF toxin-antitoxin module
MSVNRGDVILTYVPNIGSPGGKVRPALIVQSDHNNARLNETIIATITSNTSRVHETTQLLIEVTTPDGVASGLLHDSAVRCERLHSIPQADVRRVIGQLSATLMRQIDDCLKAALGSPKPSSRHRYRPQDKKRARLASDRKGDACSLRAYSNPLRMIQAVETPYAIERNPRP